MAKNTDLGVVTEARRLAGVVIKGKLKLPSGLTAEQMTKDADSAQKELDDIDQTKRSLTKKVTDKNKSIKGLRDVIKRLRNAVKGEYGDDSTEYESVGGKRLSERKPPVRKPKVTA
ncbi:MAG: hypothetical protein FJ100_17610 [Deltaproteobacteria bacterium]|nr:hypothetical protein [Deltaproteobacteria bacterium]